MQEVQKNSERVIELQTGCKVNLYLRILDKRPDGYHSLETLFLPISNPRDKLFITVKHQPSQLVKSSNAPEEQLEFSCSDSSIPLESNTLTKAYAAFKEHTGFAPQLSLHLEKHVPHGAGLGGGSANAAGLLLCLNKLLEEAGRSPVPLENMIALAARIGADVPFFLLNKPALATGIGEELSLCANPFEGWQILILCPGIHISTAMAFKELDQMRKEKKLFFKNFLTSSPHQANSSLAHGVEIHNDFEAPVFKLYPELSDLKERLLKEGADFALLCGSGSSIFGLFHNKEQAKKAEKKLDKFVQTCFISAL